MTAPTAAPPGADEPAPDGRRRWSWSGRIQLLIIFVNIVFWAVIFTWTLTAGDVEPTDWLDDRTFPTAAESRCADSVVAIDALGLPISVDNARERADFVEEENAILIAMVDDLATLERPTGEQGEWVSRWLDDWRVHIEDRQEWADSLQAGDDHAFTETDRAGQQVSTVVDGFAVTNEMPSCATPGDV